MGETVTEELKFHTPDAQEWTIEHYVAYSEGRKKADDNAPEVIVRYHGARELIRRGFVLLEGPAVLVGRIKGDDQTTTPLALVGAVVRAVAVSIESAFYIDPN